MQMIIGAVVVTQTQTGGLSAPNIPKSYCDQIVDPQAKAACVAASSE